MGREWKRVLYSFESGDESLPHLKDLVSDVEDSEKKKIIDYLSTNCGAVNMGPKIRDEINPDCYIGYGYIYSDDKYVWRDTFTNYVKKYNIPVPVDFREHILKNYQSRTKRHIQLKVVNCLEIQNKIDSEHIYKVQINTNGMIKYSNLISTEEIEIKINPKDAAYIINPITTRLFCYDSEEHGYESETGYHWCMSFYIKDKLIDVVEGWPGEDAWRYSQFKGIVEFAERYIPMELGSKYMN